jgi:DNA-directed RNA polymerase specialized sigma24 family protein
MDPVFELSTCWLVRRLVRETSTLRDEGTEDEAVVTHNVVTLDTPIAELNVSARVRGMFVRKNVETLRDALALDPRTLADEKNFGRRSLAELRALIELVTGQPWESARENPAIVATVRLPAAPHSWNAVRPWLSSALAERTIDSVANIPARMRTFAARRHLRTLGALFDIPMSELVAEPNLGRKSIADTIAAVVAAHDADSSAPRALEDFATFSALLRSALAPLRQIERIIFAGRAGLGEPPSTLEELGQMLGVTRERVRQLESRALKELQRDRWWIDALTERAQASIVGGIVSVVALAERDPWLATSWDEPTVFDYVCERLLGARFHRVTIDDEDYFASAPQSALDERWSAITSTLKTRDYPCDSSEIDAAVRRMTMDLGESLYELFRSRVEAQLDVHEGHIAGFGADRRREILHWLGAQEAPVTVTALAERFGRGRWPDDMVFVERGVAWVRERLEHFDSYVDPVSDVCVKHMRDVGPERQWSCAELAPMVRSASIALPPWFGPWPLAALLRRGERVRYLGRGIVALPDVAGDRVYIHELLVETLREAGGPLPLDVLAQRARAKRSIAALHLATTLRKMPFVRVAPGTIGLWDRDVPGDDTHVARANELVFQWLSASGVGLAAARARSPCARRPILHPMEHRHPPLSLSARRSPPDQRRVDGRVVRVGGHACSDAPSHHRERDHSRRRARLDRRDHRTDPARPRRVPDAQCDRLDGLPLRRQTRGRMAAHIGRAERGERDV